MSDSEEAPLFFLPLNAGSSSSDDSDSSSPSGNLADPVITSATDFDYSIIINDTALTDATEFSLRALAFSPDKTKLYTCLVLGSGKHVRAYNVSDGSLAHAGTYTGAPNYCKAAAVHTSGKVYFALADSDRIGVYNADLSGAVYYAVDTAVGLSDTGNNNFDAQGIAVFGNYLYASSDKLGRVYRFNLNASGTITGHDATWNGGTGYVQLKDGAINITSSDEPVQMQINPADASIWVAVEDKNMVFRIDADGTAFTTPLTIPANAQVHAIAFFYNYILISYGAVDGAGANPHGIGVFNKTSFASVTTLLDTNSELRNAQGIVANESTRKIYVVDGFFGSPNNFSLPPSNPNDENASDLIMALSYNK